VWKVGAAALFSGMAILIAAGPTERVVAWAAAALLAAAALRDAIHGVRLAADSSGVTVVTGFTRRRLSWAEIETIKVDARSRLGVRSELLEIDTGVDLYLLSAKDLNAPVSEVLDELSRIRAGRHEPPAAPEDLRSGR
jgi:hypothetical protein